MRDIVVVSLVLLGCIATLKRPWIGVMLWTWLSIMNPHRYTYGFAYSAPLAAMAVASVAVGLFMSKERESPFKGSPVVWLVLFMFWMTLSWLNGLDVSGDYEAWKKVMKIDGMILVALMLLHSKQHIFALTWVAAGSLAILGAKGGIFTIVSGGNNRVWGPGGSFIEDNNAFALALVMTIPLLRFLQMQLQDRRGRLAMFIAMVLLAASALGSYSRGALLAIAAMMITLWWRGKNKFISGILFVTISVPLLAFMPAEWVARMNTISTYEEDGSAMGRIGAWWNSWNIALHYFTGAGFNTATRELFARFSPYPDAVLVAHSIYFQVLGNHGFPGLAIFLGIWVFTWKSAGWLRHQKGLTPQTQWTADLGALSQVSLVGYLVGGAFLNLAYFDLPYCILVLVVLTRVWVQKKGWLTEPVYRSGWKTVPGLASTRKLA